jgi:hypothetical protein
VRNATLPESAAVALVDRMLRNLENIAAGTAMGSADAYRAAIQDLDAARGGLPADAIALFDAVRPPGRARAPGDVAEVLSIGLTYQSTWGPVTRWIEVADAKGWRLVAGALFANEHTTDAFVQEILRTEPAARDLMFAVCDRAPSALADPAWRAAFFHVAFTEETVDLLARNPQSADEVRSMLERMASAAPGRLVAVVRRPGMQVMLLQYPDLALPLLQHPDATVREVALLATGHEAPEGAAPVAAA